MQSVIESARAMLGSDLRAACDALRAYDAPYRGQAVAGLLPDSVRLAPERRFLKARADAAFAALRAFNGRYKPARKR